MQKLLKQLKFSLLLVIVFTLLFSTAAMAYDYYPTYKLTYYRYYSPQNYYYNYQPYKYYWSYQPSNYYWNYNWYKPEPKPVPEPKPEPTPQPEPEPKPEPTPQPAPVNKLTADEQKMLNLINKERTSRGLEPLKIDMQLVKLARMKSKDMIENNYFSHNSPTYGSPFDMMKKYGVTYRTAGENIAGAPDVVTAHNNLMNSDGHRKNILNPNFTHIGIGIVDGSRYGKIYTQMFIGK